MKILQNYVNYDPIEKEQNSPFQWHYNYTLQYFLQSRKANKLNLNSYKNK